MIKFAQLQELIVSDTLNAILGFLKVVTMIWFVDHWIACIFYAVSAAEIDSEPQAWIIETGIVDQPNWDKYITSLYWALTTTTTVRLIC